MRSTRSRSRRSKDIAVPGWFHSRRLYELAVERCDERGTLVELGSCFGESTVYMGKLLQERRSSATFYAIDRWEWEEWMGRPFSRWSDAKTKEHSRILEEFGTDLMAIVEHYLREHGITRYVQLMQRDSAEAATEFCDESVDFVYLDTVHTYSQVIRELRAWLPKIKPHGLIGGDDLGKDGDHDGGVERAVREIVGDEFSAHYMTWHFEKGSARNS